MSTQTGECQKHRSVKGIIIIILKVNIYIVYYHHKNHNQKSNVLRALSQFVANRNYFSDRLKKSSVSISSFRYAERLFHADSQCRDS